MMDTEVPLSTVVAVTLWVTGLGLIVLGLLTGLALAPFGLFCALGGGVLNVRGFVRGLERREVEAFNLGRESVRAVR